MSKTRITFIVVFSILSALLILAGAFTKLQRWSVTVGRISFIGGLIFLGLVVFLALYKQKVKEKDNTNP